MISIEFIILFLAFSIPLVCTPGPGNIILAMSGARSGLLGTVPLIIGIDITYVIFTLFIGFGLGELFVAYPFLYHILKYAGTLYLLYLSYKIWHLKPGPDNNTSSHMGFKEGVVLTLFNPKAHLLMILMFSQFLEPDSPIFAQVFILTIALALINIPNHFVWSYLGDVIARRLRSEQDGQKINIIFSILLISVATYILISS